ncbi:hypothetical protein R1sor_027214 [Riccia sorocarpa]|uniref:Reverse transcriptase domain-containing protein n=1 Tax=Riccia sorocarpa TaxID=122646 RepID=A0ABD3GF92_9MARC
MTTTEAFDGTSKVRPIITTIKTVAVSSSHPESPAFQGTKSTQKPYHKLRSRSFKCHKRRNLEVTDPDSGIGEKSQPRIHTSTFSHSLSSFYFNRVSSLTGGNRQSALWRQGGDESCSLTKIESKFRDIQACTFVGLAGSSLIDYLLANKDGRILVQKMTLGPIVPESDHRFLCCEVAGFIPRRARRDPVNYLLTGEDRSVYVERLSKEITVNSTAVDVSSAILRVAKAVSLRRKVGRRAWYDVDCELARQKAIAASPEDRNGAFRKYKHFLRSKKRRFLQEEQKRLLQELRKDPKLFWGRICAPGTKSELSPEVLMTYVQGLYFFPDSVCMPVTSGPALQFRLDEVTEGVSRLNAGRAVDLAGLNVELLKWGGGGGGGRGHLLQTLTSLLNQACTVGLPTDWTFRKVVPLHKAGPKCDPHNYRTIMVASVFAKLLGGLLEGKLNTWCESNAVRAPVHGGFRRKHSLLDHAFVLRVLMEEAKRSGSSLFLLFIDFSKAFDTISRYLVWTRLVALGVPIELINVVITLYSQVWVKFRAQGDGVASNLGVIQGSPLSPTLFGLVMDSLFWTTNGE